MAPVREMVGAVSGNIDGVLVAGDIGDEIFDEFCDLMDGFKRPVLVAYGNYDATLPFKPHLSRYVKLLQGSLVKIGPYYFTGFSGCPTKWGNNPHFLRLTAEASAPHRNIQEALAEAERQHKLRLPNLRSVWADKRVTMLRRAKNPQSPATRRRLEKHDHAAGVALGRLHERTVGHVLKSEAYRRYQADIGAAHKQTLVANRDEMFRLVTKRKINLSRLVVVTHERLEHINNNGPGPLLHVFGHRHQFKSTVFKGTHFLNAAALDPGLSAFFGSRLPEPLVAGTRGDANPGLGYCIVSIDGTRVSVERKSIQSDTEYLIGNIGEQPPKGFTLGGRSWPHDIYFRKRPNKLGQAPPIRLIRIRPAVP